jgi:hypothetical protein
VNRQERSSLDLAVSGVYLTQKSDELRQNSIEREQGLPVVTLSLTFTKERVVSFIVSSGQLQ